MEEEGTWKTFFYGTHAKIGLRDLHSFVAAEGSWKPILSQDGFTLALTNGEHFCTFGDIGLDMSSLEECQERVLDSYRPASTFVISFRWNSLDRLAVLLKALLGQFGGWIGCDDGTFARRFSLDDIDELPGHLRALVGSDEGQPAQAGDSGT